MKYIVELLLTYEVDAPDLRQAQITAYKRAIDYAIAKMICSST
jgi:hypothetical protein